jgi:hypothetical protein
MTMTIVAPEGEVGMSLAVRGGTLAEDVVMHVEMVVVEEVIEAEEMQVGAVEVEDADVKMPNLCKRTRVQRPICEKSRQLGMNIYMVLHLY